MGKSEMDNPYPYPYLESVEAHERKKKMKLPVVTTHVAIVPPFIKQFDGKYCDRQDDQPDSQSYGR